MNQHFQISLALIIGIAIGVGGYFLLVRPVPVAQISEEGGKEQHIARLRVGTTVSAGLTTNRYVSEPYGFSIEIPKDLSVREFDEGGGAMTIVFQKPDQENGFQMFIVPYGGDTITPERIAKDLSGATIRDQKEIVLSGGIRAVHFMSNSPIIGESTEVWFIKDGYLYEVTTYAPLDSWLAGILGTIRFDS